MHSRRHAFPSGVRGTYTLGTQPIVAPTNTSNTRPRMIATVGASEITSTVFVLSEALRERSEPQGAAM